MDFGEKREVGREILSLSNLLYRKIEYDKKNSGIYDDVCRNVIRPRNGCW